MQIWKALPVIAVIGAGTLLSGCATRESVERAQMTADQARGDAASAKGAADRAQGTADGATKLAGDAMTSAQAANDKIDKLIADMQKRQHNAHHRRHHQVASAAAAQNCPVPHNKTGSNSHRQKAAALRPATGQTARN